MIDRTSPKHDNTTVLPPFDSQVLPPFDSPQTDKGHISHNSVDVTESNHHNLELNGNNEEVLQGIVGELARCVCVCDLINTIHNMQNRHVIASSRNRSKY